MGKWGYKATYRSYKPIYNWRGPGNSSFRYDMVFIDAFDKSGKVPPVLVDGDGTFLQSLNKVGVPDPELACLVDDTKHCSCLMSLHGCIYIYV